MRTEKEAATSKGANTWKKAPPAQNIKAEATEK